ncbi:MAG: hypothetical protein MUO70_07195 [Euryarchaeota archaeon]|nr:hypothetical protein [Euryarchaeota archaeon]
MFKYINNYEIYQCPVGDRGEYVTYAMSHAMNTWNWSGGTATNPPPTIRLREQIKRTAERFVFLDAGVAKQGAFFIRYNGGGVNKWYDAPPMRHGKGTTFSFADGHASFRKWSDTHTLDWFPSDKYNWGAQPGDDCDCDLRWFSRATWGNLSSEWPLCPDKKCPD